MIRLAVFDCDGTLADGAANICVAMGRCFDAHHLAPPPREATRRIVGLSLAEAMASLHPDAEHDVHLSLADSYRTAYGQLLAEQAIGHEPLFDGIADTVAALVDAGWTLGVATGKSDRGLCRVLDAHGLRDRFATLQTADRHPSKPHPAMLEAAMREVGADPAATVMIGDTSYDMAMATAAGATPLGVGWGYHAADELTAAGAVHVALAPAAIVAYLALP